MSESVFTVEPGTSIVSQVRTFAAPRDLVFRAMTDPELIAQWWGPAVYINVIDEYDPRPGGRWRIVQRDSDGAEYPFHGYFHLIDAPSQVVQTFEFEGLPERHVVLETMTLTEENGVTTLTQHSSFQSVEDRDGMVASGMEGGAVESLDRLEALLATL